MCKTNINAILTHLRSKGPVYSITKSMANVLGHIILLVLMSCIYVAIHSYNQMPPYMVAI